MNFLTILKIELKKNFKSILRISFFLSLMTILLLGIFDPELFSGMEELFQSYPKAIRDMVGGMISMSTIGGFYSMEFLSIVWLWVGINIILKAAQDIPNEIDNKSIDLILSKPIKRWEYALGKHLRFIIQMLVTFIVVLLTVFIFAQILPNLADETFIWKEYIATFFWAFLFCLSLECTAFLCSAILPRKKASSISFALFIFFFFIGTYYTYLSESMQGIRFASMFYYYEPIKIMVSHSFTGVWTDWAVLIIYSAVTTIIAIIAFNKRDIPV